MPGRFKQAGTSEVKTFQPSAPCAIGEGGWVFQVIAQNKFVSPMFQCNHKEEIDSSYTCSRMRIRPAFDL